ncbi:MAG: YqgE/AlgH family protein [bacterium]
MNLKNHFLIAMPGMLDQNFADTLTLICEHNDDGAAGFIVNRPTDMPLSELLQQQDISAEPGSKAESMHVYSGGPVDIDRGFIIHSPDVTWEDTQHVSDTLCVTASQDAVIALGKKGEAPEQALFTLGYAGWGGQQLEQEVIDNTWLTTPADKHIIFDLPDEERCAAAARQLGIDLQLLNTEAGHA